MARTGQRRRCSYRTLELFQRVFWVDRLVLVALGRSSWWENSACDGHDFFLMFLLVVLLVFCDS